MEKLKKKFNKFSSTNLDELQEILSYNFEDQILLLEAITHASYLNEHPDDICTYNYERLEFFGDAILEMVISEYLYMNYHEKFDEGNLTKIRSKFVCETSLAKIANDFHLGKYVRLGKGEEKTGGRERDSLLCDIMEAIIAAMYIDGGYKVVKTFVFKKFEPYLQDLIKGNIYKDYKSALQEEIQINQGLLVSYQIVKETGPQHDKIFYATAVAGTKLLGSGHGKTKKLAEQAAAKDALLKLY